MFQELRHNYMLCINIILFKNTSKFIGEICNLAGGMACMESGVHTIELKELIKNTSTIRFISLNKLNLKMNIIIWTS